MCVWGRRAWRKEVHLLEYWIATSRVRRAQGNGPRQGGRATLNKILLVFRQKQEAVPVQAQSPFLSIHCLCLCPGVLVTYALIGGQSVFSGSLACDSRAPQTVYSCCEGRHEETSTIRCRYQNRRWQCFRCYQLDSAIERHLPQYSWLYHEPSELLPNHNYPEHMFCSFGFGIHNVLVNTSLILLLLFLIKHIVRDFKISRKFTSDGVQGKLGFSEGKFTTTVESLELLF